MRLLNTHTLELQSFLGDFPSYAILSHCWGDEEVIFSDLADVAQARKKEGFSKVEKTCEQAVRDEFDWVWIDTCCIDKSSSAELSEAINSMFAWYKNSTKCYAYLADVQDVDDLARSEWFRRAWTLQELLAPSHFIKGGGSGMDFYSRDWVKLGGKADLSDRIMGICGIEKTYLLGRSIYSASISMRMSWAAERRATRSEDIAYSLLGLFDVNMPLLYGEGKLKAFRRLQEEIMKISEDETLFAWESAEYQSSSSSADVLASDPQDFSEARNLVPFTTEEPVNPYSMTHRGLRIWLQLFRIDDLQPEAKVGLRNSIRPLRSPVMIWSGADLPVWGILRCYVRHDFDHFVAVPLQHLAADIYTRDLSTSVALVHNAYLPQILQSSKINGSTAEREVYIRNSRISSISNSTQRRFGFLFRNLSGLKIGRESLPLRAWEPKDRILQGDSESKNAQFWHASLVLILPTVSHSTIEYATCLSLGCENGASSKIPRAWCYLDDNTMPKNDIDLPRFHAMAESQKPRREVKHCRSTNQDESFSLKVTINEEKVHGQHMFVVNVDYIKGGSNLELAVPQSSSTMRGHEDSVAPVPDQDLPSFALVDQSAH